MKKTVCVLVCMLLVCSGLIASVSYAHERGVDEFLRTLDVGNAFHYQNLTIIPVYARWSRDQRNYETLDEAVKRGDITITELNGGSVPEVRLTNNSDRTIILIAGEILSGCRQDRLVGRDALIGPHSKDVILPVYCSEHGRWTAKSSTFYSESYQAEPVLRGMLYERKSQQQVWDRIGEHSQSLSVASSTQALQDVYRSKSVQEKMGGYVTTLESYPNLERDAVGVVVGVGGRIVGIDMFANPELFSRMWPKLLKSYAALAVSYNEYGGNLDQSEARRILQELYRANITHQSGLDLGEELRTYISGMICSILTYQDNVVHIGVFMGQEDHGLDRHPQYPDRHPDRIPVIEPGPEILQ